MTVLTTTKLVMEHAFDGGLLVRIGYRGLRVRDWTRDELLEWLLNEGYYECGMAYCDDEELREEVLLQKAALGQ